MKATDFWNLNDTSKHARLNLASCRRVFVQGLLPIDTIAISNQITWSAIIGKPFNNLLCRPHSSRVLGDIEMQDATSVMRKNHEDIQDASLNCRDREEIDRNELPDVIAQECSPCLRWFLIPTRHQT